MMKLFPLLLSFLLCALPLAGFAQEETAEDRITEITSDKLFFDYEKKKAIFTGNVVVTDPDLHLTSDKLIVYLTAEDEIDKMDAQGAVEVKMEGLHSRSGKAVYTVSDGVIVLTERAQVSREGSVMQAEKITYWRFEDRVEAFPRARVIMFREPETK